MKRLSLALLAATAIAAGVAPLASAALYPHGTKPVITRALHAS